MRQHIRRPQTPESFAGFSDSFWSFAILTVIGSKSRRKGAQHSSLPHGPTPPTARARPPPPSRAPLVSHPDLSHLDPRPQLGGQVLHQLPEVDPSVRREVEDRLAAVEEVLGPHQFHRKAPFRDPGGAERSPIRPPAGVLLVG